MITPIVVLVGRPNVGKSTMFNRLTKTQNALVADYPGLTRDRQYGEAIFENKSFIVVDTGGLGVEDAEIDALMSQQSEIALQEANFIFFLVDAISGLTSVDEKIFAKLRKLNKPLSLIINKIDGLDEHLVALDFQKWGLSSIFCVSASHGRGFMNLLQTVTADFAENAPNLDDEQVTKVALVGRPNVGKSTLINRIFGEDRVVVYDIPGTTRDSIVIPFIRNDQHYSLIDTAGVRRKSRIYEKIEKFSIIKTLQSIKEAHVCLLLIDAQEGLTDQDMQILRFIIESGKALVIIVNKWDIVDLSQKKQLQDDLDRRLKFATFAKIRYISALHGYGINILWSDIDQAYQSATNKLSTPHLTRLLQELIVKHVPPLVGGRRIKMRYAHSGGHNPPIIVIHGNQLDALPDTYKRYLAKAFVDALKLVGTPLKLEFKSNVNPFKDKKNKLTARQIKKRSRLIRFIKKN